MSESDESKQTALLKRLGRQLDAIKAQIEQVLTGETPSTPSLTETPSRKEVQETYTTIIEELKGNLEVEFEPIRKATLESMIEVLNSNALRVYTLTEGKIERSFD